MSKIKPISYLKNNSESLSNFCREDKEPVYITKDGKEDMVVMNIESFQEKQDRVSLYIELEKAEIEIANGAKGKDFFEFSETLSRSVHGKV